MEEHTRNAKIFKAFCDEKRLKILELLRNGEKCVCFLAEEMKIGQSSLSYHMKILCESGVVDSRQDGKWTYYYLSENGCKYTSNLLTQITTPNVAKNTKSC